MEPRDDGGPRIGRIDLTEAYAAVRRRAKQLRRRRIISSIMAVVVLAGVFSIVGAYYVSTIPLPEAVSLPETTTVYYSDGTTVMARLGEQNRVPVRLSGLPEVVPAAVVAAVDPGFWEDSATLISRQYARLAAGVDTSGLGGKARVVVMAWKLEDTYTKEQILEFFVNTIYFGRGAYGIEAAARAYFGVPSTDLTGEQAIVLAGVIASPGDGTYDPTVNPRPARDRFIQIRDSMVSSGAIDADRARSLAVPRVRIYDPTSHGFDLEKPTGHVVAQVLSELRRSPVFAGKPPGFIENGGYRIVTTVDARIQQLLERTADETVPGSVMHGQTGNLQAAAVVVEPGTGRIVAYFGGHDGTGADYAGWHYDATGTPVGYGAHPAGQTFDVYTLAAALKAGISVRSWWDSPPTKQYPGRGASGPVRDFGRAACQPTCTLVDASAASLNVPYFDLATRLGASATLGVARDAGIDSMWLPESADGPRRRVDLRGPGEPARSFSTEYGLGRYPITVLDQANGMATLAAAGVRAQAHFVREVIKEGLITYAETLPSRDEPRLLGRLELDDLVWTMSQSPAGRLPGGRPVATKTGEVQLGNNPVDTAHAWIVGFTGNLAMAVWIGNEEIELPLRDLTGARVSGASMPAAIFTRVMARAHEQLGLARIEFRAPTFTGDDGRGNTSPPAP